MKTQGDPKPKKNEGREAEPSGTSGHVLLAGYSSAPSAVAALLFC